MHYSDSSCMIFAFPWGENILILDEMAFPSANWEMLDDNLYVNGIKFHRQKAFNEKRKKGKT